MCFLPFLGFRHSAHGTGHGPWHICLVLCLLETVGVISITVASLNEFFKLPKCQCYGIMGEIPMISSPNLPLVVFISMFTFSVSCVSQRRPMWSWRWQFWISGHPSLWTSWLAFLPCCENPRRSDSQNRVPHAGVVVSPQKKTVAVWDLCRASKLRTCGGRILLEDWWFWTHGVGMLLVRNFWTGMFSSNCPEASTQFLLGGVLESEFGSVSLQTSENCFQMFESLVLQKINKCSFAPVVKMLWWAALTWALHILRPQHCNLIHGPVTQQVPLWWISKMFNHLLCKKSTLQIWSVSAVDNVEFLTPVWVLHTQWNDFSQNSC